MSSRLTFAANVLVLTVFAALVVLPWGPWLGDKMSLAHSLAPPSLAHPLGTDNLGRDLLVRIAAAARGGVLPMWLGVVLGSVAGLAVAMVALVSAERRQAGTALVAGLDVTAALVASVPIGLVAFTWAVLEERAGLTPVLLSLGILLAVRTYLETRDLFRHDSALAFWTAHVALGGSLVARLWRYGLGAGWKWPLLRTLAFHLRAAVAIEASLSYLGFGIQEPQASYGNMLASHFDLFLKGRFEILIILAWALLLVAAVPSAAVNVATTLAKKRAFGEVPKLASSLRTKPLYR